MPQPIRVVITGINGRMGRAACKLVHEDAELELVGAVGRPGAPYVGTDAGELSGFLKTGILVSNTVGDLPPGMQADVMLDVSQADAAVEYGLWAIEHGIRPVIGTSGLSEEHVSQLSESARRRKLGALVVPNFSLGAVLMMEFARQSGPFFDHVEIVEMHHTRKLDAPSGTAMHTAGKLAAAGKQYNSKEVDDHELLPGSRGGATSAGVRVHSLRLPGLISHQDVIFGAPGELLTIRHDSFNTDCFMKGIKMALNAVLNLDRLVVGLDQVLNLQVPVARAQEVTAK